MCDNCREKTYKPECCDRKKKKKSECCNCVEGLAGQLKRLRGQAVIVFEKNAVIFGTVRAVRGDDSVLVLEDALKFAFFPGDAQVILGVNRLFISICEITEFAPTGFGQAETALNNFKSTNAIRLL